MRVCDFLFPTGSPEKKLVAKDFLRGHSSKQFFQFGRLVWDDGFFLELWEIGTERKVDLDSVFLQQRQHGHQAVVLSTGLILFASEEVPELGQGFLRDFIHEPNLGGLLELL